MELTAKVIPTLRGSTLTIEREFSTDRHVRLGNIAREFSAKVVELEDAAIREALIKLGWTPPKHG